MVFFVILLMLVMFNEMTFCKADQFNSDYLDKKKTTAVNGIFVILIIFSHYAPYADFSGPYDEPYLFLKAHLSQMVVATFLFYSGYGMMEAMKKKGDGYIRKLLSKFWQLLLRFDIAVLLFAVLDLVLRIDYPVRRILVSLTAWDSIGNSNWYIFDILVLYLLLFAAFRLSYSLFRGHWQITGTILSFILTGLFIVLLIKAGKDTWWYNTLLLLPAGLLYSQCRGGVERVVMRSGLIFSLAVMVVTGIYILSFMHRSDGLLMYTVWAFSFMMLVLLFTMKVSVYNPVLEWFGKHIFSIYILQRIPMIALYKLGFVGNHKYMCLIIVFVVTIPIAIMFESVTGRLISLLSGNKRTPAHAAQ